MILKEKNASFLSLSLRAFTLNLVFALVSRKIPKDNTKGRSLHLHQGELAYQDPCIEAHVNKSQRTPENLLGGSNSAEGKKKKSSSENVRKNKNLSRLNMFLQRYV